MKKRRLPIPRFDIKGLAIFALATGLIFLIAKPHDEFYDYAQHVAPHAVPLASL